MASGVDANGWAPTRRPDGYLSEPMSAARRKAMGQLSDPMSGVPDYAGNALASFDQGTAGTDATLQALARAKGGPALSTAVGSGGARGGVASMGQRATFADYLGNVNSAARNGLAVNDWDISRESLQTARDQENFNQALEERVAKKNAVASGVGTSLQALGAVLSVIPGIGPVAGAALAAAGGLAGHLMSSKSKQLDLAPFFQQLAQRRQTAAEGYSGWSPSSPALGSQSGPGLFGGGAQSAPSLLGGKNLQMDPELIKLMRGGK